MTARSAAVLRALVVRPKLGFALAAGAAVSAALILGAPQMRASTSLLLGWDTLAAGFLGATVVGMIRTGPAQIRARAAKQDEGGGVILAVVLVACVVSMAAIGAELSIAKGEQGWVKAGRIALAFGTVALSWTMVQVVFALHYAHGFYSQGVGGKDAGGLKFPGAGEPDDWDFLHFSMVIGAAAQTADIAFTSKPLRRLGTVHSLIAFVFNTLIVALTINLLASLF